MECTIYKFKRKIQCEECSKEGQLYPEEAVNRLVGDLIGQKYEQKSSNNAFRPWYDGSSGLTLMFKYPPPKKKDMVNKGIICTKDYPDNSKESLTEFSPEYNLQKDTTENIKHKESCDLGASGTSTRDSSSSLETITERLHILKRRTLLDKDAQVNKLECSSNEHYSIQDSSSCERMMVSSSKSSLSSSKAQIKPSESSDYSSRKSLHSTDFPSTNFSVLDTKLSSVKSHESCDPNTLAPQNCKGLTGKLQVVNVEHFDGSSVSKYPLLKNSKDLFKDGKNLSSEDGKKCPTKIFSKESNTNNKWCTGVSGCTKRHRNSSPLKRLNTREIVEMKKKYNLSDFHRGKWLINGDSCGPLKISGVWREVCKMLKCGQLPNCNSKYQKTSQEIWIYCDVIYSLDVRRKLKSNCKVKLTAPLTYWVHPHGSVLKV